MNRISYARAVLLGSALALSACSGKPEAQAPLNEGVDAGASDGTDANAMAETAAPATNTAATSAEPQNVAETAPAIGTTPDEQVRDDADAAGMTARLPDNMASAPAEKAEAK